MELQDALEAAKHAESSTDTKRVDTWLKALRLAAEWAERADQREETIRLERAAAEVKAVLESAYGAGEAQEPPPAALAEVT